jgi:nucleotide-binding universal stress UspA family protein
MLRADTIEPLRSIAAGPPVVGTIVIATDATHDADGAVRVGIELSRAHGVTALIISVVELTDFLEFEGSSPADIERATHLAVASREGELAAQRGRSHVPLHAFDHTIRIGNRVEEIVSFAQMHHAALIVLGAGSDGVLARLLHRHTALRVARATPIPVLAVPANGIPLADSRLWSVLASSQMDVEVR